MKNFSAAVFGVKVLLSGVAALALVNGALAADAAVKKPAVSDINARIEGAFGAANGDGFGHAAGAVTVPVGERFGFQVDGLVRFGNDDTDVGGAAHLFWRDPDKGLIGIYASHMQFGALDANVTRVGVEAEAYLGDFSLIGVGGFQQANVGGTKQSDPFADIDFAFYPTDDLRLTAGYRFDGTDSFGVVGAEYKFLSKASAKIEGQFGEDSSRVWAGLTFHIGGSDVDKSLKGRQREDDPTIWMTRQDTPKVVVAPVVPVVPVVPALPVVPAPPVEPAPPVVPEPPVVPAPACIEAQNRFGPASSPAPYLICPAGVTPPSNALGCSERPFAECYNPSPTAGQLVCNLAQT